MIQRRKRPFHGIPWLLLQATVMLVALGLLGIARAEILQESPGFLPRQLLWALVACAVALAVAAVPYRWMLPWCYLAYSVSLVLLGLVDYFPPVNGAQRWLRFGSLSLQPSEFAKLACLAALARFLAQQRDAASARTIGISLLLASAPMLLILREPDLGTAMLFVPMVGLQLFLAGSPRSTFLALLVLGLIAAPLAWRQMSREQQSRIRILFTQTGPSERPSDDGYQLRQAKQMLALGDGWGSWLQGDTADDPGAYRLPEAHTDFIFSILIERFGLPGAAATLLLFTLFVQQATRIALAARDDFGRLLAGGIAGLIGAQALINMAMTVGLLPVTGISLPFVSYGGTGLVVSGIAVGLLVGIAKQNELV